MTEARAAADPILRAARAFLLLGFAVLPVDADKRPLFSWKELQDRYPSEEELIVWWPPDHKLNLAVLTGPISGGLAVLDIDDAALAERMAADKALIQQTTAIRTPRGGLHLWVIEADGRTDNGASQSGPLVPGVADLKAKGGYVLVPPSRTAQGEYQIVSKRPPLRVDNARKWALSLLRGYGVGEPEPSGQRQRLNVEGALGGLTEGNRNETFTRVAGKLHRGGWAAAEIVALLGPHAERVNFPLEEVEKIVAGICQRYARPEDKRKADPTRFEAESLDAVLAQDDDAVDAVINDGGEGAVLTADGKGFVAGPTGVGKTNLLLRLSRCLCEGASFLGLPVPQPRTVLYVALEGSRRGLRRRLRKAWTGADPETRQRFHLAHIALNLANEQDLARLEVLLAEVRPEVLIIDPLRNAHPWDENLSHEAAHLTAILDALIDRYHVAIVCAHHDRKRPPFVRRDTGTDRVRGSTALTGWLQFCLSLDPDAKTPDLLLAEWTKTRDAENALPPMVLDFDRETLDFLPSEQAPGGKVSDEAILNAIWQNGGSYRGPDLVAGLMEGSGASDRWTHQRLRALVKNGKLTQHVAPADRKTGALTYSLVGDEDVGEDV